MNVAHAQIHDGRNIKYFPENKIGEGAEKIFYLSEDDNFVIGFYKDQNGKDDPFRTKRLQYIIEKYNPTIDAGTGEFWKKHFCWPIGIVVKPNIGILVPRFPKQYYFQDGLREKKFKWFSNKILVSKLKKEERGDFLSRLLVCRHLARAIGRMHIAGLAHSDLSSNNVLIDFFNGTCILIDIDSLVVPGLFPPNVLGTKDYMAPEIVKTSLMRMEHPDKNIPCIYTDLHSLAVMIYEALLLRHPLKGIKSYSDDPYIDDSLSLGTKALFIENQFDKSNKPANLKNPFQITGKHLEPLIRRAFVDGLHDPKQRPTAYEWEEALTLTIDFLYPCEEESCWRRAFVYQTESEQHCHFCGWKIPNNIPTMHLFKQYKVGQYLYEKHYIPIWNMKKIFKWHTRSNVHYPANLNNDMEGEGVFKFKKDTWNLCNEGKKDMFCTTTGRIKPGNSVQISDGMIIQLSKRPKGRLSYIKLEN